MATASQPKLMTATEFMAADLGEGTFELVQGEIVEMPPPRPEHGVFAPTCRASCGTTAAGRGMDIRSPMTRAC